MTTLLCIVQYILCIICIICIYIYIIWEYCLFSHFWVEGMNRAGYSAVIDVYIQTGTLNRNP